MKAEAGSKRKRGAKVKGEKDAEYGVARGIDFKGVDMGMQFESIFRLTDVFAVINFEMARDLKSYIHRIGRTARAGAKGQALSLLDPDEVPLFETVEAHFRGTYCSSSLCLYYLRN